ncbi:hypothetical protein CAC42_804 [Sphaceloma murrayae]|uniref:Imidazoleglycerol-phosphate dehydratase n=1 Tax=Sphaceloma murrayae TaxID=2082308 RepID=A0A2K1QK49_9PEZI|nr:hypothetical protein CAC42_804 [Sphaceloma murrayae]
MPNRHLNNPETDEAVWVAARGAATGAAKWGLFGAVAAGLGYAVSPVYRGLTIQFKAFLQMSAMTFGSIIEADRRLIQHEVYVRQQKKIARDAEVWRRYEDEYQRASQSSTARVDIESSPPSGKSQGEG